MFLTLSPAGLGMLLAHTVSQGPGLLLDLAGGDQEFRDKLKLPRSGQRALLIT